MKKEQTTDISFSYEMPNLDIPAPPRDLSYADFEDFRCRETLLANDIGLSERELLKTITEKTGILRTFAVHTLGSLENKRVIPQLQTFLSSTDDYLQVETAFALIRLGFTEAESTLLHCLEYPIDAYTAPPIAAGYLAKSGDPRGYTVVKKALDSKLSLTRVCACKQLFFFVPFQGASDTMGNTVDTYALFAHALQDKDINVQWQALVQLRELEAPEYRTLLEEYKNRVKDPGLRKEAEQILGQ